MKPYEAAELVIIEFDGEDVISTSGQDTQGYEFGGSGEGSGEGNGEGSEGGTP